MLETRTSDDLASSFSPVLGGLDSSPINEVTLIVLCAWCEQEGKRSILRKPNSLDHPSPAWEVQSHGICQAHRDQVLEKFIAES
jgi:hypothetical protein